MKLFDPPLQNELYQQICKDISVFYFLQKNAISGFFLYDLKNDFWLDPKLLESLGYDFKNHKIKDNSREYIFKDDLKGLERNIEDVSEFDSILRFKDSAGNTIQMKSHFKLAAGKDENSLILIGALNEVIRSPRKDLNPDQQLKRYARIIEGTNIGLWEWNIQNGETILHKQWANVLGYTLEELQPISADTWKKLSHPEDHLKCDELLNKHIEGRSDFYECECRMKHKNGEWIWVEDKGKVVTWTSDGKPEWMTGFHEDITEMKERLIIKKTFIENAPSAIAMFDTNMNYIKASDKWLKDYNIKDHKIKGKNHYELFPEIEDEWKKIHQRCLNGEIIKKEEDLFLREDGTKTWLNWEVRPWLNANNQIGGLIMNTTDISHTMKLEKIAEEKQHFLETILRNIDVGVISCDKEGNLTLFNKATKDWHGLPATDIPPSEFADYYGLFKADGVTPFTTSEIPLIKALNEGSVENEIMVIKPKNAPDKIVSITGSQLKNDAGKVSGAVIAMHDITQQKKAEDGLRNIIAKMQAILGASSKTIVIGTDTNGLITFLNKGSEKLLGYSKEELLYKGNPGMFHIEEELVELHKELLAKTNKSLQGFDLFKELVRQGQSTRNWTLKKKDGTKFPVQLTITSIKEGDEIVGYLGVGADISDLKKTEKELQSVLKVSQNQNERLKNFAHIVSHNLRSHSGNNSMLFELFLEENPEAKGDEMMIHLQTASKNLKETIDHLGEVVMINTSLDESFIKLNLSEYINMAIKNIEALAKSSDVVIESQLPTDIEILGVPAYLDSIILNFLTNGIKYSSPK
ncbi:PAS domain-containing sensor histidine kinase [Christiangramia sediminis]|uniref:histidine kinase n=1 Tax=Christiangramia sediminis TaxID=2881336 RepID=A0A9X1LHI9_9FLAO|nr:PAS domain S-box protein [Christiangramia sediminis]MCB7480466.1 PAS domain S-box protein [Christiangramia sediminis]